MKVFLRLLMLFLVTVYLGFTFLRWSRESTERRCEAVTVTIADSDRAVFITREEVFRLLNKGKVNPQGKQMDSISTSLIEEVLRRSSFVRDVSVFTTAARTVNVTLTQRLPLLRIMASNGENYYVDERGDRMAPQNYAADVPVVTGLIRENYVKKKLLALGNFLAGDDFWNSQIEQVAVSDDETLVMVPRIGHHSIYFGTPDSIRRKFSNLRTFYEKVLPDVGWNKYSRLDLSHTDRIICKKNTEKD